MGAPVTNRASSALRTSGNAKYVRVPMPLLAALEWKPGEELMCVVNAVDKSLRVTTLEQYFQERLAADRAARTSERESVTA